MYSSRYQKKIIAALGPTNTGKTYLAFERMMGYHSGVIGFPLRLLARENYDRAITIKGYQNVALVTGEERIVPEGAQYYFCTVEAMPKDQLFEFLAVDEIQMAGDPDRGHIFTDKILHSRGTLETMFMGSHTITYLLRKLVPEVKIVSRNRFSSLTYTGQRKLVHLPPRTAIVAFSTEDVYSAAELIRRQSGGAAIVMGALSPRTRNAQVDLFQTGVVDYLVATDAIGMGLNMDVDHIAFAAVEKYDGRSWRNLRSNEMAQIAGRAGRYRRDGTFGATGEVGPIRQSMVSSIENHEFEKLLSLRWRNGLLEFGSIESLIYSLRRPPKKRGLLRVDRPEDEQILGVLARDQEIVDKLNNESSIQLLWSVCQLPNFRNSTSSSHHHLVKKVYSFLYEEGKIPDEWISGQIRMLERVDGNINDLLDRIAGIRIWTYISNKPGWVEESSGWELKTRQVEDDLSDALHQNLTKRFVDQKTSVLVKRLRNKKDIQVDIKEDGVVAVEGIMAGKIQGLRFLDEKGENNSNWSLLKNAIRKPLSGEINKRAKDLLSSINSSLSLSFDGAVLWNGFPIARLRKSNIFYKPRLEILTAPLMAQNLRKAIKRSLENWLIDYVEYNLRALFKLTKSNFDSPLRGILFQFFERHGSLPKSIVSGQIKQLSGADYKELKRLGIQIGREELFMPRLLHTKARQLLFILWHVFNQTPSGYSMLDLSRVSIKFEPEFAIPLYEVVGYRLRGDLLIRVDILERFLCKIRQISNNGLLTTDLELLNLLGCNKEKFDSVLTALGYKFQNNNNVSGYKFVGLKPGTKSKRSQNMGIKARVVDENSPFYKLKELI